MAVYQDPGRGTVGTTVGDEFRFGTASRFAMSGVDGGGGFDSLVFTGDVSLIDGMFARVRNVEEVVLGGAGAQKVMVAAGAAAAFTGGVIRLSAEGASSLSVQGSLLGAEGRLVVTGSGGDDTVSGGAGRDEVSGGGGADFLRGMGGDDVLRGGAGDDTLGGGDGDDALHGDAGEDRIMGGAGDDMVMGGAGNDDLRGEDGDDAMHGGDGDDVLRGGAGADELDGGAGRDRALAGDGADAVCGGGGDDMLDGEGGADVLWGGDGDDAVKGGDGDDRLSGGFGRDRLEGGVGNDVLLSRSDAGEPVIAQARGAAKVHPDEPFAASGDTLVGGTGADTFRFELTMDAKDAVAARHADAHGVVDWHAVAGENGAVHDHWVNGIGADTILDFDRASGDRIEILGHTVQASLRTMDSNGDGVADFTIIALSSNQGAGGGAHHRDMLGTIKVVGAVLTSADITVNSSVHYGAYESLGDPRDTECCGTAAGAHADHHIMG